jgi:hypothetical protein
MSQEIETKGSLAEENGKVENGKEANGKKAVLDKRPAPKLNERILSSLSRRSVAAHPWHDLEIGTLSLKLKLSFPTFHKEIAVLIE